MSYQCRQDGQEDGESCRVGGELRDRRHQQAGQQGDGPRGKTTHGLQLSANPHRQAGHLHTHTRPCEPSGRGDSISHHQAAAKLTETSAALTLKQYCCHMLSVSFYVSSLETHDVWHTGTCIIPCNQQPERSLLPPGWRSPTASVSGSPSRWSWAPAGHRHLMVYQYSCSVTGLKHCLQVYLISIILMNQPIFLWCITPVLFIDPIYNVLNAYYNYLYDPDLCFCSWRRRVAWQGWGRAGNPEGQTLLHRFCSLSYEGKKTPQMLQI